MSQNKVVLKNIIEILKTKENKKEFLNKVISQYEEIFTENKLSQDYFDSNHAYETLNEDFNNVTPEILSFLDELSLSIGQGQYESGSYYTNKILIDKILSEQKTIKNKTVIDPAGGTGNFLICVLLNVIEDLKTKEEFVKYINKYVFMNELQMDSINIYLKRLNYICIDKYNKVLSEADIDLIKRNCFNKDFLIDFDYSLTFDLIIGNPPYLGTKSLGKEYLKRLNEEFGFSDDLYSMFVYKSFNYLKEKGFFSFVTSNTYFTLKTKKYIRTLMSNKGLYKLINNNKTHFNIMSNTAIFFIDREKDNNEIEVYNENENYITEKTNILDKERIKEIDYKFSLKANENNEMSELFNKSIEVYNRYKDNISTSQKMKKFLLTEEFRNIIKDNDILPLGLIAFIATGVDFKGQNKKILHSLTNKKFNMIENENEIKYDVTYEDFNSGFSEHKYIKAIKGKEHLFVKWDKDTFNYLKSIKAPLRNLSLYGSPIIYCKTSTYELTKIDKNTLCINTAGACFIKPVVDLSIEEIFNQINKTEIKDYIKNNINNSLCFTPNDLKLIPIKIIKKNN